jgi:tripartite-type tricarboxylate transporter receptor subunit TctC
MRLDVLPDIPTLGDFLPGYEASSWYGIGVPKTTPVEIIDKLNKDINAGRRSQDQDPTRRPGRHVKLQVRFTA